MKHKWILALLIVALGLALVPALSQLIWHGRVFVARAGFPLDLEWMEGGMLVHAQRIAEGKGIYVEPSLEFIPFLYTPLYQGLLALLSGIFPLGYLLGRTVSLLAFALALAVLGGIVSLETEGWKNRLALAAVGALGAAAVAASFAFTGAFYDLVRSDSLLLAFEVLALALAYRGQGWPSAVGAGVLIALGFYTKQTASIVGIGIGLGLLFARFRRGIIYGLAAALVLLAGLFWLVKTSDGWFWTYIFKLHQSHPFRRDAAFSIAPAETLKHGWPIYTALGIATLALALGRKLRRADAILWAAAIAGEVSAIVGFGTAWAFSNAYIPAVFFPALAAAVFTGRLFQSARTLEKWGAGLCAFLSLLFLGYQSYRIEKPAWKDAVPSAQDRVAADRLLLRLKELPSPLFIPFHTYYAVLAGKEPFVHRMGVRDVADSLGRPKGLDEALANQKFGAIVLDWKSQPGEWPHVDSRYHLIQELTEGINSVRMFAGAQTSPRQILIPTLAPPPLPPGGKRLFDFERGDYFGFSVEEQAMGQHPAPAPIGMFGRYAVDSARLGPALKGRLRSTLIPLTQNHLAFTLMGPADPELRIELWVEERRVRTASAHGTVQQVVWEVAEFQGQLGEIVILDNSTQGGIAADEFLVY